MSRFRFNVPDSSTDDDDFVVMPRSSAGRKAGPTRKPKVADVQNEKKVCSFLYFSFFSALIHAYA